MYLLLVDRVKPRHVISKLNPADLPPPKDLTEEMRDAEDETVVMPASSGDRIASTPGGNQLTVCMHTSYVYVTEYAYIYMYIQQFESINL